MVLVNLDRATDDREVWVGISASCLELDPQVRGEKVARSVLELVVQESSEVALDAGNSSITPGRHIALGPTQRYNWT